jgi:hypothetical protein
MIVRIAEMELEREIYMYQEIHYVHWEAEIVVEGRQEVRIADA